MSNLPKKGQAFDLGIFYAIDDKGSHESQRLVDIVKDRRLVFFGGPAPFSRLDTQQATEYAELSQQMLNAGIDMVYGIYVQDAFVCREFENQINAKVGSNPLVLLGDGDAFFVRSNNLEYDYTQMGLSTRSIRWAAVIKNGRVEYFVSDPFSEINKTSASELLKYLNAKN
jgi:peroxiredoxin